MAISIRTSLQGITATSRRIAQAVEHNWKLKVKRG